MKKLQILLAEDEPDLREVVAVLLQAEFDCDLLQAADGTEALRLLAAHPGLDLVISDFRMPGATGEDLFRYLQEHGSQVPFILWSGDHSGVFLDLPVQRPSAFLRKPCALEDITETVRRVLGDRVSVRTHALQYVPVGLRLLVATGMSCSDFFLRLSEAKFVKTIRKGDRVSPEQAASYRQKGVTELFVRQADIKNLLECLSGWIARGEGLAEDAGLDSALKLGEHAIALIREVNSKLGFTPEIQEFTKATVASVVKWMRSNQRLRELLDARFTGANDFISAHSIVLAHVAGGLAGALSWTSDGTQEKLVLAAFLHDLVVEDQDLAQLETLQEIDLAAGRFSSGVLWTYRRHPESAADLLSRMGVVPAGVDQIIAQHHERPDGSGFPNGLRSQKIAPLSSVLILAHLIVTELFRNGLEDPGNFLRSLGPEYRLGGFKMPFEALLQTVGASTRV